MQKSGKCNEKSKIKESKNVSSVHSDYKLNTIVHSEWFEVFRTNENNASFKLNNRGEITAVQKLNEKSIENKFVVIDKKYDSKSIIRLLY